jgi:hypothetical protein
MRSPHTEISDDEASDAQSSIASEEDVPIKEEKVTVVQKKGMPKAVVEETQESLMVEPNKEEVDEDDDEEVGEDEYGSV